LLSSCSPTFVAETTISSSRSEVLFGCCCAGVAALAAAATIDSKTVRADAARADSRCVLNIVAPFDVA
jgi:hypothetical protein